MSNLISRVVPQRIAVQLLLVMLTALATMVLIFTVGFWLVKPDFPGRDEATSVLRYTVAVTRLNDASDAGRSSLLRDLVAEDPGLRLEIVDALPGPEVRDGRVFWPFHSGTLGAGIDLVNVRDESSPDPNGPPVAFYFRLHDGMLVKADLGPHKNPPIFGDPMFQLLLFLGVSLVLLLIWVTRTLVRPLSDLSGAVASFGFGSTELVPISESGPQEVKQAARAFNRMQARIQELVERRTRMLTAIGHDLRTPLTRLRLRMELMADDDYKRRNLTDLEMMETQLEGALSFLRDGRTGEVSKRINLPSLLKTLADQYEDMGVKLVLACPSGLVIDGRPSELTRAFSNLVDNARRYDDHLSLNVHTDGSVVHIDVMDRGPGIPAGDRERLMEPFERGDEARQMGGECANFGLGLAIARAIVIAHGGALELLETPGGGLTARVNLQLV